MELTSGKKMESDATGERAAFALGCGLAWLMLLPVGCQVNETRFEIVDFRANGESTRYFELFPECYYDLDAHGHVDVVARRRTRGSDGRQGGATQILHLTGIWRAVPGRTPVESTQVNACVSYCITEASGAIGFEGAGFVTFTVDPRADTLTGKLESSAVRPVRHVGDPPALFERAEVTGQFRAVRDARRVVRILNEVRRLLGPLPRYDAPPVPL